MDIKNTVITAQMVIHSLVSLLENENVDISSVKFKVGSDSAGYESPEFELEKLIDLAIGGLGEIKEAQAVPEGFVLVPKEPTKEYKDVISQYLDELWMGEWGCDWDGFICVNGIDPNHVWKIVTNTKAMIEAQEQGQ